MKLIRSMIGAGVFAGSVYLGWRTAHYVFFVTMVVGFWMLFEGMNAFLFRRSLLKRPRQLAMMVVIGAGFGLVLDFFMTLTHIIEYYTMDNWLNIFLLYLGWGVCLPAMVESYQFFYRLLPSFTIRAGFVEMVQDNALALGVMQVLVVFLGFVHHSVPGFFAVFLFFGNFLIYEHILKERGLLERLKNGDMKIVVALALAAALFCFAWEGMDIPLQQWAYTHLFWLEPKIVGIPLVAFFGYFCWYVLFFDTWLLWDKDVWQ